MARILPFPPPNPDDDISDEELARIKAHLDGLPAQFWIDLKADLDRRRVLMDAMSLEERAAEQKRMTAAPAPLGSSRRAGGFLCRRPDSGVGPAHGKVKL